jgi:hypothetical protein
MYSNYRMEVIDPMLGLNALDSIMQVRYLTSLMQAKAAHAPSCTPWCC